MPARAHLPLAGRTVVVTRALSDAGELVTRLEALGAAVVVLPSVRVQPVFDAATARAQAARAHAFQESAWAGFASRHGAEFFAAWLARLGLTLPAQVRLAAIGPGTAAAVQRFFGRAAQVAPVATAEGLAELLLRTALPHEGDIVLPMAKAGRQVVVASLLEAGFVVHPVVVYETVPMASAQEEEAARLRAARVDAVLFTSPSTVTGFLAQAAVPAGAQVVSIGPTTSGALRAAGLTVHLEAAEHTLEGLVEVLRCLA